MIHTIVKETAPYKTAMCIALLLGARLLSAGAVSTGKINPACESKSGGRFVAALLCAELTSLRMELIRESIKATMSGSLRSIPRLSTASVAVARLFENARYSR
ncbi:hypothetical protein BKA63DRAFT_527715 [Paraphoma chrysanthemicola]|nr:hypothetical protein BKA63DRAFT_527715 [Paraphoma chrysanthemicola]